ncbi:hypothetical protein [Type-E symbiont of Plautia stali]|uniref:hypothetical protein n=1 Tax=Type-E symbiont of Plautia stali TaxID=1560357 RepID=UPI00073F18CC|nr:hypothetical protein [Type-E symbiont of Plautia stali]
MKEVNIIMLINFVTESTAFIDKKLRRNVSLHASRCRRWAETHILALLFRFFETPSKKDTRNGEQ